MKIMNCILLFSACFITQLRAPSQTECYLRALSVNETNFDQSSFLKQAFSKYGSPLITYKSLIQKMLTKEKELKDTHYVFYHAIPSIYFIIQDMTKEFYMLQNGLKNTALDHWIPFRIPGSKTFDNYSNVNSFLEHVINTHTEVNDHFSTDSSHLISANVALFGNSSPNYVFSESSFDIFLRNRGALTKINPDQIIDGLLTHYKISTTHRDAIKQLASNYMQQAQAGALVQIFIPKSKVHEYAYLARNYGKPYGSPQVAAHLFDRQDKRRRLPSLWSLLKSNPTAALSGPQFSIESILEKYQTSCTQIPDYDQLSGRIVISNKFLLDPYSGVQIYRYHALESENPTAYMNYKSAMQNLAKRIY